MNALRYRLYTVVAIALLWICFPKIEAKCAMQFEAVFEPAQYGITISGNTERAGKANVLVRMDDESVITSENVSEKVLAAGQIQIQENGSFSTLCKIPVQKEDTAVEVLVSVPGEGAQSKTVILPKINVAFQNPVFYRKDNGMQIGVCTEVEAEYTAPIYNAGEYTCSLSFIAAQYDGQTMISCRKEDLHIESGETIQMTGSVLPGAECKLMLVNSTLQPVAIAYTLQNAYQSNIEKWPKKIDFSEADTCTAGKYRVFSPLACEVAVECIMTDSTKLTFFNDEGIEIFSYTPAVQTGGNNAFKLIADSNADCFDVYINGTLLNQSIPYTKKSDNIARIAVENGQCVQEMKVYPANEGIKEPSIPEKPQYTNTYLTGAYAPDQNAPTLSQLRVPSAPSGIVYEAENMQLKNYTVSSNENANGSANIRVTKHGVGTASAHFLEQSGYYQINIGYLEQDTPVDSAYRLYVNDQEIDFWYSKYDDGMRHVRKCPDYVFLQHGDLIALEGYFGGDNSELDYIEFIPVQQEVSSFGTYIDDAYWVTAYHKPSGWNIQEEGGSARTIYYNDRNVFYLHDVSQKERIAAMRKIEPASLNGLSLETVFCADQRDGMVLELKCGMIPVVQLKFQNNGIYYTMPDGTSVPVTTSYPIASWNHLNIWFASDGSNCIVSSNNNLKTDLPLYNEMPYIDHMVLYTEKENTAAIRFSTIRLFNGWTVYDDFNTVPAENLTRGWIISGNTAVRRGGGEFVTDANALNLNAANQIPATARREFTNSTGQLTAEFTFKIEDVSKNAYMTLNCLQLEVDSGDLKYGDTILWNEIRNDMWYTVRVESVNGLYKIYINNIKKAEFTQDTCIGNGQIVFQTLGTLWIDDIRIKDHVYQSSVEEPVPINTGVYDIGVQACDLWREGHHYGWDSIRPYDSRIPIGGFFNDGDICQADQEIKWMTENGISVYVPCWYRPNSGESIKKPLHSAKLEQGMMHSPYMDKIQFMISWENSAGTSGAQDFIDHVVGYWIEHYFKHPSYYCIDNKPVIAVWNPQKLASELGGNAQNKAVFDEIDRILQEEGFAGAIWVGKYFGTAQETQAIKNMGYDYTYMYGFGDVQLDTQIGYHETQRQYQVLDAITSLSQGWGSEPWGYGVRKLDVPLDEFWSGLRYMKEQYMDTLPSNSLASRFTMLGNWNEIGEGHMFIPTNFSQYGYLEGIKHVFEENE